MDLSLKYGENYIILGALRQYVEQSAMLASVNFWRDSLQNYQELRVVDKRTQILNDHSGLSTSEFLAAFISEDFPRIEEPLSDNILTLAFKLIDEKEGERITNGTKAFLMHYAACIVKASKEDYLSFIGLSDSISDEEESFLTNFKLLLQLD